MDNGRIPKASLGRIPTYLGYLESLTEDIQTVSATVMAKELGLGEVQVRKDLSLMCKNGRPKVGYNKNELKNCLESILAYENGEAVIVGAGKLGRALLDYDEFEKYGTRILTAFDSAVTREEKLPSGKRVLPVEEMQDYCERNGVRIGIITTPADSAQEVLNHMYECGIRLVWCFAACKLYRAVGMTVQYENLALSLAHLKWQSIR